jgi:L-aspartate oxidase
MTAHAGPVRDAAGLTALLSRIERLETAHPDAAALTTARLVAQAALDRRESRGGHWREDWPETLDVAAHAYVRLNRRERAAA